MSPGPLNPPQPRSTALVESRLVQSPPRDPRKSLQIEVHPPPKQRNLQRNRQKQMSTSAPIEIHHWGPKKVWLGFGLGVGLGLTLTRTLTLTLTSIQGGSLLGGRCLHDHFSPRRPHGAGDHPAPCLQRRHPLEALCPNGGVPRGRPPGPFLGPRAPGIQSCTPSPRDFLFSIDRQNSNSSIVAAQLPCHDFMWGRYAGGGEHSSTAVSGAFGLPRRALTPTASAPAKSPQ